MHPSIGHTPQQLIGRALQLRHCGFDDHRRHAAFAECFAQVLVQTQVDDQPLALLKPLGTLPFKGFERSQLLAGSTNSLISHALLQA